MEYRLSYFELKARGETARMLFRLGKQEFTDIRVKATAEDWIPRKPGRLMHFISTVVNYIQTTTVILM